MDQIPFVEILQSINKLYRALEENDYAVVLSLLSPTCRWRRDGQWHEGAEAILASLNRRRTDRAVRHEISKLIIERDGDGFLADYLVAGSAADAPSDSAPPYVTSGRIVADSSSRFVALDGRWLFESLDSELVFR